MAEKKPISKVSIIVPVIICVVYAAICMLNLRSPIWHNEAYSAYITRGSFSDILTISMQNVHCPVFYFLLKIWSGIFGYTDVSLRFFSIFCGALTIIFLFHLLKKWFGTKTAIIASILLGISPVFILLGQEINSYTFICLIIVLIIYILDSTLGSKPKVKTMLNAKRKFLRIYLLILIGVATTTVGIVALLNHTPKSEVKEIVLETEILNVNSEPVLMNSAWDFYDAVFYANEQRPIYGIAQKIDHDNRNFKPIYEIGYNLISDLTDFANNHNKFWYITDFDDNAKSIEDYNLPAEFKNYMVVTDLIQDRYAVFELEKTE